MPTTALGALAASTAPSIEGESILARPTTATNDRKSSPKLIHTFQVVGGSACTFGLAASVTGVK